jgi:hypothetical protein
MDWGTKITKSSSSLISVNYPQAHRIGLVSLGQSGVKTYSLTSGVYNSDLDVTLQSAGGSSVSVNPIE